MIDWGGVDDEFCFDDLMGSVDEWILIWMIDWWMNTFVYISCDGLIVLGELVSMRVVHLDTEVIHLLIGPPVQALTNQSSVNIGPDQSQ